MERASVKMRARRSRCNSWSQVTDRRRGLLDSPRLSDNLTRVKQGQRESSSHSWSSGESQVSQEWASPAVPAETSYCLRTTHGEQVKWSEEKVLVAQSCLTLCDPMDCSPPGSSIRGILQARTLEWVAIPFSRGSSQTHISCTAGRFFTIWATREAEPLHRCCRGFQSAEAPALVPYLGVWPTTSHLMSLGLWKSNQHFCYWN